MTQPSRSLPKTQKMPRVLLCWLLLCLTHCSETTIHFIDATPATDTFEDSAESTDPGNPAVLDADSRPLDSMDTTQEVERPAPDTTVPPEPEPAPVRYGAEQTHSPLTPYAAARAQSIREAAPKNADNIFMKVGDSISFSSKSLFCFSGSEVVLGESAALEDTLNFYLSGAVPEGSPFDRKSLAVLGGKTASWAIKGSPSPLASEIAAISPSVAIVMFGTNDSGYFPEDLGKMLRWYGEAMFKLVDTLIDTGIVPILMTIPPRTNKLSIGQLASLMNGVIRGLAQGRQTPLVDYYREMLQIPDFGLSSDGVHPNSLSSSKACHLTEEGLQYGYNLRNAVSLESLYRTRKLLDDTVQDWDEATPVANGAGSPDAPFEIDALPFTHMSDTSLSPHSLVDTYTGCGATQDESGAEWYYSLVLEEPTALRLVVLNHDGADVDIHLTDSTATGAGCLVRNHTLIEGTLAAGEYRIVLDTFVTSSGAQPGESLLVVMPCEADDARCSAQISL